MFPVLKRVVFFFISIAKKEKQKQKIDDVVFVQSLFFIISKKEKIIPSFFSYLQIDLNVQKMKLKNSKSTWLEVKRIYCISSKIMTDL
jgi:hypothetical protein